MRLDIQVYDVLILHLVFSLLYELFCDLQEKEWIVLILKVTSQVVLRITQVKVKKSQNKPQKKINGNEGKVAKV